jgi:hypothetical protein
MDGHGAGRRVDALDGLDELLGKPLADQVVALPEELGRRETPLVAAAHEERVLWGGLQATVGRIASPRAVFKPTAQR